jgi:8-oxo-dGTP pyrophosphatase MutT (NUDIX family)
MKLYNVTGRCIRPFALLFFVIANVCFSVKRARVIVQNEQDEILLVKDWVGGSKWELPGGGVRRNEPPQHAAQRELFEELSIALSSDNFAYVTTVKGSYEAFIYKVSIQKTDFSREQRNRWEIVDAQWFPSDNLPSHLTKMADLALQNLPKT